MCTPRTSVPGTQLAVPPFSSSQSQGLLEKRLTFETGKYQVRPERKKALESTRMWALQRGAGTSWKVPPVATVDTVQAADK